MEKQRKTCRDILAVFSLMCRSGRDTLAGIMEELPAVGDWRLCVVRPDRFSSEEDLVTEAGESFDGIILSQPGADAVMDRIAASRIPIVLDNIADPRISARGEAFATVWVDNRDIGRSAATHLLTRGEYKSAGYVREPPLKRQHPGCSFYSDERLWAFREAMGEAGIATSAFPEGGGFDDFWERLPEWVRGLPKPAAVMACSDMRAADVINACRAEGIAVPGQVAVIGVDHDVLQHAKCGMSISSVVTDSKEMGRRIVREMDFLFRHPRWKGRAHEVLIPVKEVFCGDSTARSPEGARLVSAALRFIAANRLRDISPADVVAHLGCNRRFAERHLRETFGKTMRQAIEEARMEEARRRLVEGESVGAVVRDMRFTSANQFYRIYKRHFGHTTRGGEGAVRQSPANPRAAMGHRS